MAKIQAAKLADLLADQLGVYHKDLTERVNKLSEGTTKRIVSRTKKTAPKKTGSFRRNIASKRLKTSPNGDTYVWYVKPPDHRLTHLLVHGHAKVNGRRTKADPFLADAVAAELPDYERAVEEAVKGD